MLEILGWGCVGAAEPQVSRKNVGAKSDRRARVQPRSALPLILGASLVHSFIRQTGTKHLQGEATWGYRQETEGLNSGLATYQPYVFMQVRFPCLNFSFLICELGIILSS